MSHFFSPQPPLTSEWPAKRTPLEAESVLERLTPKKKKKKVEIHLNRNSDGKLSAWESAFWERLSVVFVVFPP